jgi:membrane associated rhomboid family serine protease
MVFMICPSCQTVLLKAKNQFGWLWVCPQCQGRCATLELIRRAIPKDIVNKLWQKAKEENILHKRQCPSCKQLMGEVTIINAGKTEYLDVCPTCRMLWFDTQEYQRLPKNPIEPDKNDFLKKLTPEQREKYALAQLAMLKEKQELENQISGGDSNFPDEPHKALLAVIGLPVELEDEGLAQRPVLTWLLAGIITIVSAAALFLNFKKIISLEQIISVWGLTPAYFGQHCGLTFLTSFFLHGGVLHLISNVYFLLIFGDNVEDVMGKRQYLLLIICASIIGDAFHIISDPASLIPCIGASGGISGILAYYALSFPMAQIGIMIYHRSWVEMPAMFMFASWICLQLFGSYQQIAGFGSVSYMAHLGGAAIGVIFWAMNRFQPKQA